MLREKLSFRLQSAKVNHVREAGRGATKIHSRLTVALGEIGASVHRMNKIVCRVHAIEGASQRFWFKQIGRDDFRAIRPRPPGKSTGISDHHANRVTLSQKPRH
jgi:hypothetical protein